MRSYSLKISVIVPSFKPGVYLWECLDSLGRQTLSKQEFEVILVLNGCKEPYDCRIHEYLERHSDLKVVYIQTDQMGVSNARNMALDIANGEYVAFIDDDDYVSPSYLEELYSVSSHNTVGLCYPFSFKDGTPQEQISYPITETYNKLANRGRQPFEKSRKFFSGPCMKLIYAGIIQDRRFNVNYQNGEDSLFMFLISNQFEYVDYTSTNAVYYRRYRVNSAVTRKRKPSEIIKNRLSLIASYSSIYIRHPREYRLSFYLTRLIAAIHNMIANIRSMK